MDGKGLAPCGQVRGDPPRIPGLGSIGPPTKLVFGGRPRRSCPAVKGTTDGPTGSRLDGPDLGTGTFCPPSLSGCPFPISL